MRRSFLPLLIALTPLCAAPAQSPSKALEAAVAGPARTPANVARDRYRHPAETLAFFGVKPGDTVVELWPFGGWYTEILAPYLTKGGGHMIVASPPGRYEEEIAKKIASDSAIYGGVRQFNFPSILGGPQVAPGTADVVLTFRNIHNWRMGYLAKDKADYAEAAFKEIYAMLKPGGVLGIEDHRLPEKMDTALERRSGYLKVSTVKRLAEQAGFRFAGASEINANPRDTHDYPKGVWTLPPSYAERDKDRARYTAIGESDRMTLKFVKPR
jgi:predicted methyltransferase